MSKLSTVDLLALATMLSLLALVGSYLTPHIPESLRQTLAGVFIGYNSALLLALKSDSTPPTPPTGGPTP